MMNLRTVALIEMRQSFLLCTKSRKKAYSVSPRCRPFLGNVTCYYLSLIEIIIGKVKEKKVCHFDRVSTRNFF